MADALPGELERCGIASSLPHMCDSVAAIMLAQMLLLCSVACSGAWRAPINAQTPVGPDLA
jgi:hypothetical protein